MTNVIDKSDIARARLILSDFRNRLADGEERSLRNSMDKLIQAFSTPFFNSLIDIFYYYRVCLNDRNSIPPQYKVQPNAPKMTASVITGEGIQYSGLSLQGSDKASKDDWDYFDVMISRQPNTSISFGFSIAGGHDAPNEYGDPSIYITKIAPDGIAESQGVLKPGDQIISVNGMNLENVANLEAVQILRQAGDTLSMRVRRQVFAPSSIMEHDESSIINPRGSYTDNPTYVNNIKDNNLNNRHQNGSISPQNDRIYEEVRLVKPNSGVGLGFSIAGGNNSGDPDSVVGVFITKINEGGVADKSGRLQIGDQLVSVNDIDLTNCTHNEAVKILRTAGNVVDIVICRSNFTGSEFSGPSQMGSQNGYHYN